MSECKEAEQRLKLLEQIFTDMNEAVAILDSHGCIFEQNAAHRTLFGYSDEELRGKTPAVLMGEETFIGIVKELSQKDVHRSEVVCRTRGGTELTVDLSVVTIRNAGGEVLCHLALKRDITGQKRAGGERECLRPEAQEADRRFHELVQSLDAIVWEADAATWQFLFVSQCAEAILGYPNEQWLTEPDFWVKHIHPDDQEQVIASCLAAIEARKDNAFEYRMVAADGRTVWLRDIVRVIQTRDGGSPQLRGVMVDITESKHLEERLHQSQKMEALGHLAGGIAHDFNNVMAAILGFADLGLKETSARNPIRRRLLKIQDQGRNAVDMTRRLLAFASRQILEERNINLNQTVTGVVNLLEGLIGEHIEMTSVLVPDLKEIQADPAQLEQVLMNLCLNARDAMPAGGRMLIETQNADFDRDDGRHHANARAGHYVMFSVSDTGVGMDGTTMKHMFEPFFTTKEKSKASGLGLAVVYGIVKQHDGFIYVDSEPGRGTTFCVYLPVGGEATEKFNEKADSESVRGGTETILLAEDHGGVREVAQETLESLGYRVVLAGDGEEAVQIFRAQRDLIALVVLDVVLPKMNGLDAYAKMCAMKPSLRVLFSTGHSAEISLLRTMVERGVTVLQKPYSTNMLALKVRENLDRPEREL